ncbi:electron transport complex subunit RsxG [Mangrovicoccus sp. HB161399]|uniref:electron transport complex subunit RsxG n=1 Tax=Mangrovicoccus sp. HB161399 TaxID=2720392 RepID=UPI0015571FBA|nr:electron transport complex subunit RsxG [Mangrovicoccus sp. HB161399]
MNALTARLSAFREAPAAHGVLLALFALFTALVLAISDELTRGPIADRATEDLNASLVQVIPDGIHDNDLASDRIEVMDGGVPVAVYQATRSGTVTGAAFERVGYGYGGAIKVLIGLDPSGELLGVRVLAHAETPGLGDKIETAKSDWIHGFEGKSLDDPSPERWKVKRDGGEFDQFSGATITPRAVVAAVKGGLDFFAAHRDEILTPKEGN